jgi:hypothetical protein
MDIPQKVISNTESTTQTTTETTTESTSKERNSVASETSIHLSKSGVETKSKRDLEDAAFCLFMDWRDMVEKPNIQWDSKGWRAKRIIKHLREGVTYDDIRLAVRGMLTDDFLQKNMLEDIDWLCKDENSRIEMYKAKAIKKGIKVDAPIRKSNGYELTNDEPKTEYNTTYL